MRTGFIILSAAILTAAAVPAQAQDSVSMKVENQTQCQTKITVKQNGVFLKLLRLDALSTKDFQVALRGPTDRLVFEVVTSGCNDEARYRIEDVVPSEALQVTIAEQPAMTHYYAIKR
jgi:hypothetical protein